MSLHINVVVSKVFILLCEFVSQSFKDFTAGVVEYFPNEDVSLSIAERTAKNLEAYETIINKAGVLQPHTLTTP